MKTRDPKILSTHPAGLDLGGLKKLYLPSDKAFALVDVPEMQFVMIDGEGNPAGETYSRAMRWLFSVVYPIKLIAKARMGKHFLEPPMECLWWADDMEDFVKGNKETFKWRIMIVTADWVSDEMFNEALSKTEERLGEVPGRECPTGSRKSAATVNTSYPTFCISAMLSSSRSRCAFSIQRCS